AASVVAVLSVFSQDVKAGYEDPTALAGFLAVGAALPLLVRRRYPLTALVASCTVLTVHLVIGYPEGALPIVILILTYSVGAWCPTNRAVIGLGVIYAVLAVLMITDTPGLGAADVLGN